MLNFDNVSEFVEITWIPRKAQGDALGAELAL